MWSISEKTFICVFLFLTWAVTLQSLVVSTVLLINPIFIFRCRCLWLRSVVFNLWVATSLRVAYPIFMIHNSSKITGMKEHQNNFRVGGYHNTRNCMKGHSTRMVGNHWTRGKKQTQLCAQKGWYCCHREMKPSCGNLNSWGDGLTNLVTSMSDRFPRFMILVGAVDTCCLLTLGHSLYLLRKA